MTANGKPSLRGGAPAIGPGLRLSRREFVAGAGALVVSFALLPRRSAGQGAQVPRAPTLPGSLKDTSMLDAWIRVDADGTITVFTGKVEFGQGVKTALIQLAAEELVVAPARIQLVTADTSRTPNEGYTAGSNSMKDSGTAIMNAAAQVREMLVGMAASRLGVPADSLAVQDGRVRAADGRSVAYAELVAGRGSHSSEWIDRENWVNPAAFGGLGPPPMMSICSRHKSLRLRRQGHCGISQDRRM